MSTDFLKKDSALILVADDDKSMRMLLRAALEQAGYQVVEATNGSECLAAYQQYQPDAILLDLVMPQIDGFACCAQLRTLMDRDAAMSHFSEIPSNSPLSSSRFPAPIPILVLTVLDDSESVEQAYQNGATDYITKPIHWAVLRHRLYRLIQHTQKTKTVPSLLQQLEQAHLELERLATTIAGYP